MQDSGALTAQPSPLPERVRVLVVDDSPLCRDLLASMLSRDPGLELAGAAADGEEAVAMARDLQPDVITMDLRMPVMDGIEATRCIMAERPTPILVVTGHAFQSGRNLTFEALRAGALDLVIKPDLGNLAEVEGLTHGLTGLIKFLAGTEMAARGRSDSPIPPLASGRAVSVVAMASSAGGPRAVQEVLRALPGAFGAGVVLVQHVAEGFSREFAAWLDSECELTVRQVQDGDEVRPGLVLVAPAEAHVRVMPGGACKLFRGLPIGGCRPSADVLLASVARHFGEGACGVVFSGMGDDGVAGLAEIKARGGITIAQDQGTRGARGLPGAAVARGIVDAVLPVERIATELTRLCPGRAVMGA